MSHLIEENLLRLGEEEERADVVLKQICDRVDSLYFSWVQSVVYVQFALNWHFPPAVGDVLSELCDC